MEQQKQSHPILYSCLALIVLAIIGFLCLVMYYAWIQKYGTTMKKNELYTKFRQKSQDIPQITYRISDLVITSDDPLIAGKTSELEKGVRVKVEHTMMGPFSLNYLH